MASRAITRRRPTSLVTQRTSITFLRHLDWILLLAAAAITAIGLEMVETTTRLDTVDLTPRQQAFVAVGVVGMAIMAAIPVDAWRPVLWPLYVGVVGSILAVQLVGFGARGSERWIQLPGFQLQPSELGKLLIVFALAGLLVARRDEIERASTVAAAIALAGIPATLVFIQPDLGTTLIYGVATLVVLFVAGMRVRHLLVVLALVVALAATVVTVLPTVGVDVLEPYQQDRLTSFLNPSADPAETGYNQYQSRIAIGSGGMVGKGTEGATQTNGAFLPENHTDFVFASLGEQRGFIGGALLIGLFTIVLWRILRAVAISSSMFGSLVAAGIFGWFLASLFINVGMTIGVAPVTGIPLPLVSYGGSGTISALLALGVVQSIVVRSRMAGSRLS